LTPREGGRIGRRLLGTVGLLLVAGVLTAGLGALWTGHVTIPGHAVASVVSPTPRTDPIGAPVPSPSPNATLAQAKRIVAPSAPPARLLVPAIKVDAQVEPVGLDSQGRMATPSQADRVAWYKLGSTPGDVGDAVIAGHLDWTSGPAVFWYLSKVRAGDEITIVRADGTRAKFVTDATKTVPYDRSTDSLFAENGTPSLTLITCAGTWDRQRGTYLQRLAVHATLVPTGSSEKPGDEGG
jgi:LPXTG-site transpeptidase (sortase) family protein